MTVFVAEDFGMTPAAPAASASRTEATRSAIEWISTAEPVAITRFTFSVTVDPSPSDRSSTTTSFSRPSRLATNSSTEAAASTKSKPASMHAALSPRRTDSWSSTTDTLTPVGRTAASVVSTVVCSMIAPASLFAPW